MGNGEKALSEALTASVQMARAVSDMLQRYQFPHCRGNLEPEGDEVRARFSKLRATINHALTSNNLPPLD